MENAELIRTANEIMNNKIPGSSLKDFLIKNKDNTAFLRKVLELIILRNDDNLINELQEFLNELTIFYDEDDMIIDVELDALDPIFTQIKITILLYSGDLEIFEQELANNVYDYNYQCYISGLISRDIYESIKNNNIIVLLEKIKNYGLDNRIITSNDIKDKRTYIISMIKTSLIEKYYDQGLINYRTYKDLKEYVNQKLSELVLKR